MTNTEPAPDTGWTQGRTQPISDGIVMVAFERGAERSWVDEGIVRAIRAESGVALQEARAEAAKAALQEASDEVARLRTARELRADAAEAEVVALRDDNGRLRGALLYLKEKVEKAHWNDLENIIDGTLEAPAASRPLPAVAPTCTRCSGVCERCSGDGWEECGEGAFCEDGGIHRCLHGCPERRPAASRPLPAFDTKPTCSTCGGKKGAGEFCSSAFHRPATPVSDREGQG